MRWLVGATLHCFLALVCILLSGSGDPHTWVVTCHPTPFWGSWPYTDSIPFLLLPCTGNPDLLPSFCLRQRPRQPPAQLKSQSTGHLPNSSENHTFFIRQPRAKTTFQPIRLKAQKPEIQLSLRIQWGLFNDCTDTKIQGCWSPLHKNGVILAYHLCISSYIL